MKTLRLLLALLVSSWLLTSCTSYPGTSSLWIGMTRDQALRAMGPPESVSSQGQFEYLNYTIAANGGYIARPYYIRIHDNVVESFGYQGQFSPGTTGPTAVTVPTASRPVSSIVPAPKVDQIRVLSTFPQDLALDRTTRLKVKVTYLLQSQQQGTIILSFNTKTPDMSLSLARKDIPGGSGELELEVDVLPVTWPGRTAVTMQAILYPRLTGGTASSLDHVVWDLPVRK